MQRVREAIKLLEGLLADLETSLNEAWSGRVVSKQGYENPDTQQTYGYTSKRVEMSPDEYLNKCAKMYRRKGAYKKTKNIEQEMTSGRSGHTGPDGSNAIEYYKKKLSDSNPSVSEPWIMYNPRGNNNNDQQDGIHRVMAAKELGHEKIPVHIFHNSSKKTPATRRYYKRLTKTLKKEAGEDRAYLKKKEERNRGI